LRNSLWSDPSKRAEKQRFLRWRGFGIPCRNTTTMFTRFFFKRMSITKQGRYLKKKAVVLGTRIKDNRRIYIYMLNDFFVEVQFLNDSIDDDAEKVNILQGLDNLNSYLENEFRTTF
jgi:hypothetical protein